MTEFRMNAILPIVSYTNGVGFPIQFAYQPKAILFAAIHEECSALYRAGASYFRLVWPMY